MARRIFLLSVVLLLVGPASMLSQTPSEGANEVWPEFTLNYDPIRKIGLVWAIRKETSDLTPEKTLETTATFIYRVKPFVRNALFDDDEHSNERNYMLSFAANYELTKSFGDSTTSIGHKVMFDVTPRYNLPGRFLIHNRTRFELRWTEGEKDFWFRNRMRLEHKIRIGKVRILPYATGEIIWTKGTGSWNRNVLSGGVELTIVRRRAMLDLNYQRKNCDTCSFADVNALGVNFNLFFGKR
ncbi:MAG: hypothetical protein DMF63_05535 [Acidobacteria bacterium]|nr:MAG: hypothetical protein DMF63_05535 [Acidobacteriota bacterium]